MRQGDENEKWKWDLFEGFKSYFEAFEIGVACWVNRCNHWQFPKRDAYLLGTFGKMRIDL